MTSSTDTAIIILLLKRIVKGEIEWLLWFGYWEMGYLDGSDGRRTVRGAKRGMIAVLLQEVAYN